MKGNGAFLIVLVILILVAIYMVFFIPNRELWQIGGGLALFVIIAFFVLSKLK